MKNTKNKMDNHTPGNEISLFGQSGAPGIVMGKATLFQRRQPPVSSESIDDDKISHELARLKQAREMAEQELRQLSEGQQDENAVELIHTQIEIINDPELCQRVESLIENDNKPADLAIKKVFEQYLTIINQQQNDVLANRSVDISDIRDRLIQLVHNRHSKANIETGAILVASELSPREVIEFSGRDIKGILMDRGGTSSHAAIIARSMNIPTVVGLKEVTNVIQSDQLVIVDGKNGEVKINPDEQTQAEFRQLIEQQEKEQAEGLEICRKTNQTLDGTSFSIQANIEFIEELNTVQQYCAEGIGLLRTESIYLQRRHFGDQQKQEQFYEEIMEATAPHPVTIRLFDAGGDKFFEAGNDEQNPFLGWRGIRMLLDEEILLRNQLNALLTIAGRFKNRLRILVPMVSSLKEVAQIKQMIAAVQRQLRDNQQPVDEDVPLGIMVEVPSVALQARAYARDVDFLSIGTNDLTQYVLAVDRGNELISQLYNQCHPALWRLIKQVADAANEYDIPLSVCGELAANPAAACCLMGMGIRELSMIPTVIPAAKKMLRVHTFEDMQKMSNQVLQMDTLEEIEQIFNQWQTSINPV